VTVGSYPTRYALSRRGRWPSLAAAVRRFDGLLLLAVLALAGMGSLLVWSATRTKQELAGADPQSFLKRHLLTLAVGLILGALTSKLDYRKLRAYVPVIYLASLLGLAAVLTSLGATINGSHSWIVLGGGFSLQPSEFAKVALVIGLAMLLGEKQDAEQAPLARNIRYALLLAAVPMGLVLLQPDLGTVMVFAAILLGMLLVSGAPSWWTIGLVSVGGLGALLVTKLGLLSDYQLSRFAAFANPALDPEGIGYHTNQALIAIGSGKLAGKGLFQGSQTTGSFVPEQQTDFIFTVAGEELGFLGGAVIILLFAAVLWRAGRIALRAREKFSTLVATGVMCWFAFQVFENIGMTLRIMPVTGLPLPFVSYGGSSMFANLVAVGLLQNIHMRHSSR